MKSNIVILGAGRLGAVMGKLLKKKNNVELYTIYNGWLCTRQGCMGKVRISTIQLYFNNNFPKNLSPFQNNPLQSVPS